MATKRQLKALTSDLQGLLEECKDIAAEMDEAGMVDHPMVVSLKWLIPQLEEVVDRGMRGDLTMYDDDQVMAMTYTVMIVRDMCDFTLAGIDYAIEELHQQELAAMKMNPRSRRNTPVRKM